MNISIEEYRNKIFTDEEEWNYIYNPNRFSIEALNHIEVKKRGKGEIKKVYKNSKSVNTGPYYDPYCIHVHNWKKHDTIKNFIGEQNQFVKHVQFTNYKPGTYCSICHKRNIMCNFKFEKNNKPILSKKMNFYDDEELLNEKILNENFFNEMFIYEKWRKIIHRLVYIRNNKKIIYNINKNESILKWPWELTKYQLFKLNNPRYKNNLFIDFNKKFYKNYAIIC